MFRSGGLGDELQALQREMSRLLHGSADDVIEAAKHESEAVIDQVKAVLSELGETLAAEEEHVEKLVDFVSGWDRAAPMVIHCFAGISRSTAGAFITACALNPNPYRFSRRVRSRLAAVESG